MTSKGPKPGTKNALTILFDALGIEGEQFDSAVNALHKVSGIETGFKNIDSKSTKSRASGYYQMMPDTMKANMNRFNDLVQDGFISESDRSYFEGLDGSNIKGMSKDLQAVHSVLNWAYAKNVPFKSYLKDPNDDTFANLYKGHVGDSTNVKDKVYKNDEHITNMNNKLDVYKDDFTVENAYKFLDMEYSPNTSVNPNGIQDVQDYQPTDRTKEDYLLPLSDQDYGFGGPTHINNMAAPIGATLTEGGGMLSGLMGGIGDIAGGFSDLAGGPLGAVNMGAGIVNSVLQGVMKDPTYNKAGGNAASFDFGADYSTRTGSSLDKAGGVMDSIGESLGEVPLVGSIGQLAMTGAKGLTNLFAGKADDNDLMSNYMAAFRGENTVNRKNIANAAFAETGGEFNNYLSALTNPELVDAGTHNVQSPYKHGENPQGGTTVSMNPDGSKNKVEEGEFVIDGPNGQKLIFTNKF